MFVFTDDLNNKRDPYSTATLEEGLPETMKMWRNVDDVNRVYYFELIYIAVMCQKFCMNCIDVYQNLTCVYEGYLFIYSIVKCVYLKYKEFYTMFFSRSK